MGQIITDCLENTAALYPNKNAFVDNDKAITFAELREQSLAVAQEIILTQKFKSPIVVFFDKSVDCIIGFISVLYSGNFYSPIDVKMPVARIKKIMETLKPEIILTDRKHYEKAKEFSGKAKIILQDDVTSKSYNLQLISSILDKVISTDLMYVLFTSGSTGNPKGVAISHHSMLDYIEWAGETYDIGEKVNFGSQSPFYFCMSVLEIYATLKYGCTTYIIPSIYFSFPGKLMDYIKCNDINMIYWVPSALSIVANMDALKKHNVECLKWVLFSGEIMPVKVLNYWRKYLPDANFVNVYGPTELTADVSYYIVNREFKEQETLPIGHVCRNSDIILLDSNDKEVEQGEIGELCVRGSLVASGYYGDNKRTESVFVQNPMNKNYPELIYRTGDLAFFNSYGELEFAGRKDFQIKHMGHRIELGEIEANVFSIEGVKECCCLYEKEKKQIVLFYTGNVDQEFIKEQLYNLVPNYMLPNKRINIEYMPRNINGKIDRVELKKRMECL